MGNVRLVTARDLLGCFVLVPVQERKKQAKAAINSMAMTLSALMNVNVGPAQILQGSMVMEGTVIMMENVRLVTARDLLGCFVLVPVQERKVKAKAAINSMAMTLSASMPVNVGPVQILEGRIVMERAVITMENVSLMTVGGRCLEQVVLERVNEKLKISGYC